MELGVALLPFQIACRDTGQRSVPGAELHYWLLSEFRGKVRAPARVETRVCIHTLYSYSLPAHYIKRCSADIGPCISSWTGGTTQCSILMYIAQLA